MYQIVKKRPLNDFVTLMEVHAPHVAGKAQPGQFIIFRVDDQGERVPLTIAGYDRQKGTVTIIFQKVGFSTRHLDEQPEGGFIRDFVGPLGEPSHLQGVKRAAVVGGGLGVAIAYPQAKALFDQGAKVDGIMGFRNESLIILEEEMHAACENLFLMTDDGSNGNKGFVTDALKKRIEEGIQYDAVVAIGPLPMMKAVSELTRPYGIKTIVSMNPIMIDGTGMCGGCRVTVGCETKFACVDGPDFDGHLVDFDGAMARSRMYRDEEAHFCRLTGGNR